MAKKSSNSSADVDPDLIAPKMAMDEIDALHSNDPLPPPPPPPPMPMAPPPMPMAAPTPLPIAPPPPPAFGGTPSFGAPAGPAQPQSSYQQQVNADIDKAIITQQLEKENEHWAKAFWRPAMGWLYMIICFMDFVGFPLLTIFLPVIFKPFGFTVPYQTWTSLTLSNGGLIHLAFGAILGVSAFTRGQEKMAGKT
jgi:hypothetical protein